MSGAIPPSSGTWYQVALGTFINSFMSPTRIAAPVYHVSYVNKRPGLFSGKSILRRISVLGEGLPVEILSHTSKPSTGTGFESIVPPTSIRHYFETFRDVFDGVLYILPALQSDSCKVQVLKRLIMTRY